jgi:hypothetical protein
VTDTSSWLWVVIDVVAVLILAAAMAYGAYMWRTRSRNAVLQRVSDEATDRLYHRPPRSRDEILRR